MSVRFYVRKELSLLLFNFNIWRSQNQELIIYYFSLNEWHIVEIELFGPIQPNGNRFSVKTVRCNPADPGVVTGSATYNSFLSSILRAQGKGAGVHLC